GRGRRPRAPAPRGRPPTALAGTPPGTALDAVRPLRSPRAREHARRGYARLLAGADAGTTVRVLGTAVAHDVSPGAETLRECGLRAVGPALLRPPPPAGVYEAVRRWPDLRAGALAYLERSAAAGESLHAVFAAGLGAAVTDAELAALPALREAALIARTRDRPERRVDTALALLSGRTPAAGGVDGALLDALWPDGWSLGDAHALLARLPREALGDRGLASRVAPLLERPSPDGDHRRAEAYGALCDLLGPLPLADALPDGPREVLTAMTRVRQAERRLTGTGGTWSGETGTGESGTGRRPVTGGERERPVAGDGLRRPAAGSERERLAAGETLAAVYNRTGVPAIRSYLRLRLPVLLASLPGETLAELLSRVPDRVRDLYLAEVERELGGERAVTVAAAAFGTFFAALRHERTRQVAEDVQDVLLRTLPNWRRRDLNAVEEEVRRGSNRTGDEFKRWRAQARPRRGWLPGRLFHG
ncbi:GTPase-associated protein 1-related protein, partial [Streptosporangium sp. DT93]|uniref:GTPase-associated protein 1-related protein n=1 Tax=Streptosporangium sp. DT93 TaxID=3393428 RepID=UPI003CED97C5